MTETPFCLECAFPDASERFSGHFVTQVVIPGAALVDRVAREIELVCGQRVNALKQVKFVSAVRPGAPLLLTGSASESLARFDLRSQAELVCSGTLALGPAA